MSEVFVIKRRRRIGQWLVGALVLYFMTWAVTSALTSERFLWSVVWEYMFAEPILTGLTLTLQLAVVATAVGIVMGVILALMRLSSNVVLREASRFYTWIFRGVPLLVQLIFWFNLAALFPTLSIGIPFGPSVGSFDANVLITAWTAAILGLGLHEGAYMSEIVRAGIASVGRGQAEAAAALGMSRALTMRKIIMAQALRFIIPPTGNQVILMVKMTALVSAIALGDLLHSAQVIYARTFQPIPLLIVVSLWYLFITSVLMLGQTFLERRLARSDKSVAPTPAQGDVEASQDRAGAAISSTEALADGR